MKLPIGSKVISGFGHRHYGFCTANLDKATVVACLRNYRVIRYGKAHGYRRVRYAAVPLQSLVPDTPEVWALIENTTARLEAIKEVKERTISAEAKKVWESFRISFKEFQKGM